MNRPKFTINQNIISNPGSEITSGKITRVYRREPDWVYIVEFRGYTVLASVKESDIQFYETSDGWKKTSEEARATVI